MTRPSGAQAKISNSAVLKSKIDLARSSLASASNDFWNHPELPALYPEFLFHLHCAMRTSVPLLSGAHEVASELAATDPIAAGVAEYFLRHMEEERDHADWLLEDMVALGGDREELLKRIPPSSVAALVGSQYYWIRHVHPAMLLAYLVVLEGEPMSAQSIENYAAAAGIPSDGLRTLVYHAKTDLAHRDELYRLIDNLPLTPELERKLGFNAMQVIQQLTAVFQSVIRKAS